MRGIGQGAAGEGGAIAELARKITDAAPELGAGAVALVDSPRWPRDLDLARPDASRGEIKERSIDAALRALVRELIARGVAPALRPLALFPTPLRDYFHACVNAAACKPHLRALGRALFPARKMIEPYGGTFTRFMIAGFAIYRALTMIAVESYEAYPDLQFRLWSREPNLPPKKAKQAREKRQRIVEALGDRAAVAGCGELNRLDALDAAILALSAVAANRRGTLLTIEHPAEGRFMMALDQSCAAWNRGREHSLCTTAS